LNKDFEGLCSIIANYVISDGFDIYSKPITFEKRKIMITYTDHFREKLDNISSLLLTEDSKPKTIYVKSGLADQTMSREGLDEWYGKCLKSFPLYTDYISQDVSIHSSFRHYFNQYHKSEDFKEAACKPCSVVVEDLERDGLLLDLEEYIQEWLQNLFWDFAELMESLKAGPVFACIKDDLIIMKNLLKFYQDIRQSDEQQLVFFHRISIPKPITDLMTDILIELFTDKITMLSPEQLPNQITGRASPEAATFKISWLGSQQEFAELVHELTAKGYWNLPDQNHAAQARHLARMFDFSASQKKKNANIAANVLSYLSPILDKKNKETTFSYLKPGYRRQFACIPPLGKSNK
jgi:hypothetical protein